MRKRRMGRTWGELGGSDGGPIAEALGDYFLAFAEVEAALTLLFARCKSASPDDWMARDGSAWRDAEREIDERRWSAGKLADEVDQLIRGTLNEGSKPEASAREDWGALVARGKPIIAERNDIVHKQLKNVDHVLDNTLTGLILRNGDSLTEESVRSRAAVVWEYASELRDFYGTLLWAKSRRGSEP